MRVTLEWLEKAKFARRDHSEVLIAIPGDTQYMWIRKGEPLDFFVKTNSTPLLKEYPKNSMGNWVAITPEEAIALIREIVK